MPRCGTTDITRRFLFFRFWPAYESALRSREECSRSSTPRQTGRRGAGGAGARPHIATGGCSHEFAEKNHAEAYNLPLRSDRAAERIRVLGCFTTVLLVPRIDGQTERPARRLETDALPRALRTTVHGVRTRALTSKV